MMERELAVGGLSGCDNAKVCEIRNQLTMKIFCNHEETCVLQDAGASGYGVVTGVSALPTHFSARAGEGAR